MLLHFGFVLVHLANDKFVIFWNVSHRFRGRCVCPHKPWWHHNISATEDKSPDKRMTCALVLNIRFGSLEPSHRPGLARFVPCFQMGKHPQLITSLTFLLEGNFQQGELWVVAICFFPFWCLYSAHAQRLAHDCWAVNDRGRLIHLQDSCSICTSVPDVKVQSIYSSSKTWAAFHKSASWWVMSLVRRKGSGLATWHFLQELRLVVDSDILKNEGQLGTLAVISSPDMN